MDIIENACHPQSSKDQPSCCGGRRGVLGMVAGKGCWIILWRITALDTEGGRKQALWTFVGLAPGCRALNFWVASISVSRHQASPEASSAMVDALIGPAPAGSGAPLPEAVGSPWAMRPSKKSRAAWKRKLDAKTHPVCYNNACGCVSFAFPTESTTLL
jgi:hypothetical protein